MSDLKDNNLRRDIVCQRRKKRQGFENQTPARQTSQPYK